MCTLRKTCRGTDVCMHAYTLCMHANGWQSIFFLTPATSCNTSMSGSLSPPIRICALVIRGGLRQKSWAVLTPAPQWEQKRWSCAGRCHAGVFAGCSLCTQQHLNDTWRGRWWFNITLCHSVFRYWHVRENLNGKSKWLISLQVFSQNIGL